MRLISLCPSLTETVFDLGLGQELVGRTRYCVEPAPEVEQVEELGGTKDPDIQRLIELKPDLVLVNEEENRLEDFEALRDAGIPCHVSFPRGPAEVPGLLRDLGAQLGAAGRGEELALRVEEALEDAAGGDRVSFLYLCWRRPWMAAGIDTFASALLGVAGGQNALPAGAERYPSISPTAVAGLDPDLVLLPSEPFPFEGRHVLELAGLTGLPAERFLLVDGRLLSWHGSLTARGIAYASGCLEAGAGRSGSG